MKISVLSLLLIAAVFGLTLLTGCDEGMQMMKPAMEKPVPPEIEPPMGPEGSIGLTKEEAREKARGVVIDTVYAMQILLNPFEDDIIKGVSATDDERARILLEKTNFTWAQVIQLVEVHLGENPHEAALAETEISDGNFYIVGWVDVVAKYLEITFLHPTKTEDEVLDLFRGYAKDGKTTLSSENLREKYFSIEGANPPDGIRRTDDGQLLIYDVIISTPYIGYNHLDPTQEVPDRFLPLITIENPELNPGKYRVKPRKIEGMQGKYISQIRVLGAYYSDRNFEDIIIEFTYDIPEHKLKWRVDGDEVIIRGDEIVVEILRKIDTHTRLGPWATPFTDHIYEARPIRNLSRPEVVFEFVEFEEEEAAEAMAADAAAE